MDYLVVGSGPAGVQAAQTLVEAGKSVLLLDVGFEKESKDQVPDQSFLSIRKSDPDQYRYFLGRSFEGIPLGKLKPGAGLTPPRQYVTQGVEKWIPIQSKTFTSVESLAQGGLGGAWGLGCFAMTRSELQSMGLSAEGIQASYQTIASRIGISGALDDCSFLFRGDLQGIQSPLKIDDNAKNLLGLYQKKKAFLNSKGIFLGQPMLSLLSEKLGSRRPNLYHDMDFWTDQGGASYRPIITLEELKKNPKFQYQKNSLVLSFEESSEQVSVEYLDIQIQKKLKVSAKKMILSAGAFGTARIVLRSCQTNIRKTSLLCNPYYYVLCVQPQLVGKELSDERHSMGQVCVAFDAHKNGSHIPIASLVSYRSLLLFRLLREMPTPFKEGREILQFLQSGFMIAGIHHPDYFNIERKWIELREDPSSPTGDSLWIEYSLSALEEKRVREDQKVILTSLRKMRCFAIKAINPGYGASIHYSGTLPFHSSRPLSVHPETGRLNGFDKVYVADGSPFTALPAKGITFTLMAYADWTARRSLEP